MRIFPVVRLLPILLIAVFMLLPPVVRAAGPVQITPASGCSGTCAYPDIVGAQSGASAGSTFAKDGNGNFIGLMACSNFSNACTGHTGVLVWSSDGGATWTSCITLGNCGTGAMTTHAMQNPGSTCIHAGALYVSGTTVDVSYQNSAVNGVANFYVDRMTISYSGNAISNIANNGAETVATVNDQTTSGFACVQQILPTPNGGGEIMIFAVEENSGPLYMFRTGVTTSAFKDLSGTASAVSSTITSQNDGSNSCSQFQPSTGDIWNFDVYDRTGGHVFVNQYPYNSGTGNWGAVTSHDIGANKGVPLNTKSAACTTDSSNAYFSWFQCLTNANAICATGAPVAGNTCTFQLWEATPSSSGAVPTQLASLTDTGACHGSQNNSNIGDGSSLTSVSGQLYLAGVDDNLFGTGCSSEGGGNDAKCQQLFIAKFTVTGGTWGAITQYTGNPSAVIGESAFASGANYYLFYSTCNNYVGTTNANDGACGVATGNSLSFNPILFVPPPPPTLCSTGTNSVVIGAGAFIVVMAVFSMKIVNDMSEDRVSPAEGKALLSIVVVVAVALLIVAIVVGTAPAGGPCQ